MPLKLLIAALRAPQSAKFIVDEVIIRELSKLTYDAYDDKARPSWEIDLTTPTTSTMISEVLSQLLAPDEATLICSDHIPHEIDLTLFDAESAKKVFGDNAKEKISALLTFLKACDPDINFTQYNRKTMPKNLGKKALEALLPIASSINFNPLIEYPWGLGGVATVARSYAQKNGASPKHSPQKKAKEEQIEVCAFGYPGIEIPEALKGMITTEFAKKQTRPIYIPKETYDKMYSGFANGLLWPIMHRYLKQAVRDFNSADVTQRDKIAEQFSTKTREDIIEAIKAYFLLAKTKLDEKNFHDASSHIQQASNLYINYQLTRAIHHLEDLPPITVLGASSTDLQEDTADIFDVGSDTESFDYWKAYQAANEQFANEMIAQLESLSTDQILEHIIWVHDYQLMLVPGMLRQKLIGLSEKRLKAYADRIGALGPEDEEAKKIKKIAQIRVAYFHHIPFPITSALRNIPKDQWGEILRSLIEADQIGFHVDAYKNNFVVAAKHFLTLDEKATETLKNKTVGVPIGIDCESFANDTTDISGNPILAANLHGSHQSYLTKAIKTTSEVLAEHEFDFLKSVYHFKSLSNRNIIMSAVDRIDPSKGHVQRLHMIEKLLKKLIAENVDQIKHLCFAMIAPESRTDIAEYCRNRDEFYKLVDEINTKYFSAAGNRNIIILCKEAAQRETIRALYHITDIHLSTSLMDGFHLGPEEYMMSLVRHNSVSADPTLSMSLNKYKSALTDEESTEKRDAPLPATSSTKPETMEEEKPSPISIKNKTNVGICVMSKTIGVAMTDFGRYALTYQPEDYGDVSDSVGDEGAQQLLKAINMINNPEHKEPLDHDSSRQMIAAERTQAMQKFVLEHNMTYWAEYNIFGADISAVSAELKSALHQLIFKGLQFIADGDHRDIIKIDICSDRKSAASSSTETSSDEEPSPPAEADEPETLEKLIRDALAKGTLTPAQLTALCADLRTQTPTTSRVEMSPASTAAARGLFGATTPPLQFSSTKEGDSPRLFASFSTITGVQPQPQNLLRRSQSSSNLLAK